MTSSRLRRAIRELAAIGQRRPGGRGGGHRGGRAAGHRGGGGPDGDDWRRPPCCSPPGVGFPSPASSQSSSQPVATTAAHNSIPANYLALFQQVGSSTACRGSILAGIGEVESDDGRSSLPGVHSGQNGFGAAGPMQIGIGGASGNTWGGGRRSTRRQRAGQRGRDRRGRRRHRQRLRPRRRHRRGGQVPGRARRAEQPQRRHLRLQPPPVLRPGRAELGGALQPGGYTVSQRTTVSAPECLTSVQTGQVPNQAVATAITTPGSSWASRTCGAVPGRMRSTAPGW